MNNKEKKSKKYYLKILKKNYMQIHNVILYRKMNSNK